MTNNASPEDSNGYLALLVVVGLILTIGYCSSDNDKVDTPTVSSEYATVEAEPSEQQIAPVDASSVSEGGLHFRQVTGAKVAKGAIIYSKNCYSRLDKDFAWSALDRCGSFDLMAYRVLERQTAFFDPEETSYFEQETIAGRYLNAALTNGAKAEDADTRFREVQTIVSSLPLPRLTAEPPKDATEQAEADGVFSEADGETDNNAFAEESLDLEPVQ